MFLDELPPARPKKAKTKAPLRVSDLPGTERDFAFVVDEKTPAGDLVAAIRECDKIHIKGVSVFDVYSAEDLPRGKKSVALSVRLEPKDKTFTEAEIEAISKAIIAAVAHQVAGKLRS